jgi:putative lipoic acid-binding regulatory protein
LRQGEKKIDYPSELTFKAVFRNREYTQQSLRTLLSESELEGTVTSRESRNGKFVSYTITSVFPDEETLDRLCSRISGMEGFMMLF